MAIKLRAEDQADLSVISAALQDAIFRVGDLHYDPIGRSVSLRCTRFQHEEDEPARITTGIRIDSVMRFQSAGVDRSNPDAFAVILGVSFEIVDKPDGVLMIDLAGGGAFRMDVECLDMLLADVGDPRSTSHTPHHDLS